jgi:FtsP/CotA-like multicopper oxidase with cupredoxin domain
MASTINASSSATTGVITTADASGALTLQTNGTDALVLSSGKVVNPTVTNYTETPYSANSSTAITLALTNGTVQIITLTGNATITMPTAVSGKSFIMYLRQDATGSRSVTWSTVNWAGGTAPTITGTASKQDIYSFFSDGTSWYGVTVGQNYTQ